MSERGRSTRDPQRVDAPKGRTAQQELVPDRAGPAPAGPRAAPRRAVCLPAPHRLLVTFILGGLTATPPLATDMYLPALPEVTDALHAPAATSSSGPPCPAC